jgi:hypothetical protein
VLSAHVLVIAVIFGPYLILMAILFAHLARQVREPRGGDDPEPALVT